MAGRPNIKKGRKVQFALSYTQEQYERFLRLMTASNHRNPTDLVYKAVAEYYNKTLGGSLY